MAPRQTFSYLQHQFAAAGLQPQTRFGQNFLIDLNLVELIAKTAELTPQDVVLEVGTGMGSLTTIMAAQAGHVLTVEIDHFLAPLAQREFERFDNITLMQQDALKSKNQLHPQVVETLVGITQSIPDAKIKLVANLPYNVATPILSNLLDIQPLPTRMVATIQRELAERITAPISCKDYSALSIWIQAQCQAEIVRIMPPAVFWPRPKVDSAILDIRPQSELRSRIEDPHHFHALIRDIFLHRRKFLRSALASAIKDRASKAQVDQILKSMELQPNVRAEELTPEQFIQLDRLVRTMICESSS
ncbi:MAG: ribosomal RNA small subunit methyltransferase A [Planctomycetales bacterium]|nr:ribosomal RNA small subunit methyltransferase A [Planctomycetales bacterium]